MVQRQLLLHSPPVLPPQLREAIARTRSPRVHAAALTGIGLLYQGMQHRLMAEFLAGEIGRRPTNDALYCVDREG